MSSQVVWSRTLQVTHGVDSNVAATGVMGAAMREFFQKLAPSRKSFHSRIVRMDARYADVAFVDVTEDLSTYTQDSPVWMVHMSASNSGSNEIRHEDRLTNGIYLPPIAVTNASGYNADLETSTRLRMDIQDKIREISELVMNTVSKTGSLAIGYEEKMRRMPHSTARNCSAVDVRVVYLESQDTVVFEMDFGVWFDTAHWKHIRLLREEAAADNQKSAVRPESKRGILGAIKSIGREPELEHGDELLETEDVPVTRHHELHSSNTRWSRFRRSAKKHWGTFVLAADIFGVDVADPLDDPIVLPPLARPVIEKKEEGDTKEIK